MTALLLPRVITRWSPPIAQGRRVSRTYGRTRWLANAEADHGGAIRGRRAWAYRRATGAAAAKAVDAHGSQHSDGTRPGKDDPRAGGAGHAPQTEPAESEAVSGDRTRPPQAKGPPSARAVRPHSALAQEHLGHAQVELSRDLEVLARRGDDVHGAPHRLHQGGFVGGRADRVVVLIERALQGGAAEDL